MTAPLLVEIGCEEIPARMIPGAAAELAARVVAILDEGRLAHGAATAWGGTRRVAVRVADVAAAQDAREEVVLGPPAAAAFGADGAPTPAGAGFARKQGIDPAALERIETGKGTYAGYRRAAGGRGVGAILAAGLPQAVTGMPFPKTMRWGAGAHRWVRPVHWIVALHGARPLPLEIFGVAAGRDSQGHRFLAGGAVAIAEAATYERALEEAFVVVSSDERRRRLLARLETAAAGAGGTLVADADLLEEVVDLVEWPGVVAGRFEEAFLDLPTEILVTTLRHHQKSFSVRGADGSLLPVFLSVANTDRDPAGHIRRGNEWVVSGRLDDARFFWNEDRKRTLASRIPDLEDVVFHRKGGSYRAKCDVVARAAGTLARRLGLDAARSEEAARLSKADLVTGLVGEFPELQGIVGGLLLKAEGSDAAVARAVHEHYRPSGSDDAIPESDVGAVLSVADKLHTVHALLAVGETPTGSRDPFGLRRACYGVFRVVLEKRWPLTLADLFAWSDPSVAASTFLAERFEGFLRDRGFTTNEIAAVRKARLGATVFDDTPLPEILVRLDAVKTVRDDVNFGRLVDLTKRVDNIIVKTSEALVDAGLPDGGPPRDPETHPAALELAAIGARLKPLIHAASARHEFSTVIGLLAEFVAPVATFFDEVLVLDPADWGATSRRRELLIDVRGALTHDFDIRELSGQAERRS